MEDGAEGDVMLSCLTPLIQDLTFLLSSSAYPTSLGLHDRTTADFTLSINYDYGKASIIFCDPAIRFQSTFNEV